MADSRRDTAADAMTATAARPAGRPRDANLDHAILQAATDQLAHVGYANTSLEAVAQQAGTTLPAIRRRYPNKHALVLAVIDSLRVGTIPTTAATPRELALAILRDFNRALRRNNAMIIVGSLLAEQQRHPELLARFQGRILDSRRTALRDALQAGVTAGELPSDTDTDALTTMLIGSFYGRYLTPTGLSATWADRVLNQAWPAHPTGA